MCFTAAGTLTEPEAAGGTPGVRRQHMTLQLEMTEKRIAGVKKAGK